MVLLQKHILQEFTLHNEMSEFKSGKFHISPRISFTVLPRKEKQPLQGDMTVEVGSMDDASPLYIKVRMRGVFLLLPDEPGGEPPAPADFPKQAFTPLFDVIRSYLTGATLMGGMSPFNLPPIDPNRINLEKKD